MKFFFEKWYMYDIYYVEIVVYKNLYGMYNILYILYIFWYFGGQKWGLKKIGVYVQLR